MQLETNKIQLQIQNANKKVSQKAILAYYNKNKSQFGTPETRDIHMVLVSSASTANKVHSLLASGESYATVAAKYSVDAPTKAKGGAMTGVYPSELTQALSSQVFAAKPNVLTGPVKTAFGYYVFTVDTIHPPKQESLAKATPAIRSQLSSSQITAAENALQSDVSKKWQPRTHCRSGFEVSYCAGQTGSTGASGA